MKDSFKEQLQSIISYIDRVNKQLVEIKSYHDSYVHNEEQRKKASMNFYYSFGILFLMFCSIPAIMEYTPLGPIINSWGEDIFGPAIYLEKGAILLFIVFLLSFIFVFIIMKLRSKNKIKKAKNTIFQEYQKEAEKLRTLIGGYEEVFADIPDDLRIQSLIEIMTEAPDREIALERAREALETDEVYQWTPSTFEEEVEAIGGKPVYNIQKMIEKFDLLYHAVQPYTNNINYEKFLAVINEWLPFRS